jgi:uncharacterized membrane protein YraQ (UPF0718 family)
VDYFEKVKDFILTFTSIFYEALPFVVLGVWIAGILQEYLPQRLVTRILPRSKFLAILIGGLLGLVFPMCECGIIPVMRRLLRKGFPLGCCLAYLLAGPIINIVVILATLVAFSGQQNLINPITHQPDHQMGGLWMAGLRVVLGYLVAVVTAVVVEWQYARFGPKLLTPLCQPGLPMAEEDEIAVSRPFFQRLARISEVALHDFVDIALFLILGGLLAASARLVLTNELIASLSHSHALLTILVMMAFAILVTLCSEADAFVAAAFTTMRPSAKLAFLVLGPMMDCKLLVMYTRIFRPRLIWTIVITVLLQVFVYSAIIHVLWENRWLEEAVQWLSRPFSMGSTA